MQSITDKPAAKMGVGLRSLFSGRPIRHSMALTLIAVLSGFAILGLPSKAYSEDINAIFKRVNEFIAQKNYPKAMEELSWANKEIQKMHTEELKNFFPDQVAGFSGQKLEMNSVLGFTNVERNYTKPGSKGSLKVALIGGSGGASSQGLGGLAQLGRMAAMMGGGQGQDTIRINGRTASLQVQDSSNSAELTVFLDSGSMLQLTMQQDKDSEALKSFATALPLDALDSYLRGQRG